MCNVRFACMGSGSFLGMHLCSRVVSILLSNDVDRWAPMRLHPHRSPEQEDSAAIGNFVVVFRSTYVFVRREAAMHGVLVFDPYVAQPWGRVVTGRNSLLGSGVW